MRPVCSYSAGLTAMASKKTRRIPGLNDGDKYIMPTFYLYHALRNPPYNCTTVPDMQQRIKKDEMIDTYIKVRLPTADGLQSISTQLWCCLAACDGSRVLLQWQAACRRVPPEPGTGPHGAG